jgi:hypothetical protein
LLRFSIALDVTVKIGSGEHDDERQIRMQLVKSLNGFSAAARVQRNQKVTRLGVVMLRDVYSMAELLQHSRPAQRGNLVAVVKVQRRRSNELNFHAAGYVAQVRNPAQTSRRSGV